MTELKCLDTVPSISLPKLVIWLTRKVSGGIALDWSVERVITHADGFKHHVSFDRTNKASDMICDAVWEGVLPYLPAGSDDHQVVAADAGIEAPQVLLRGISVTSYHPSSARQRAVINVGAMIGLLQGVFARECFPDMLREVDSGLALHALNDVLLPALSLVSSGALQGGARSDRAGAYIDRLERNRQDIEFYTGLLTRYIAAQAPPAVGRITRH